jgi:hypothetical protein
MKFIIVAMIVAILCLWFGTQPQPKPDTEVKAAPRPQAVASEPPAAQSAKPAAPPAPKEKTMEETREELFAKLANSPCYLIRGELLQHLQGSTYVLVHGYVSTVESRYAHEATCALLAYEDPSGYADGVSVDVQAWKIGVYQYESVDGALRTVDKFIQCPPGPAPTKRQSMWNDQANPLNRPAHR